MNTVKESLSEERHIFATTSIWRFCLTYSAFRCTVS